MQQSSLIFRILAVFSQLLQGKGHEQMFGPMVAAPFILLPYTYFIHPKGFKVAVYASIACWILIILVMTWRVFRLVRSVVIDPTFGDPQAKHLAKLLSEQRGEEILSLLSQIRNQERRVFLFSQIREIQGRPNWIEELTKNHWDSAEAHLISGNHAIGWAWQARGAGDAESVQKDSWAIFFDRLTLAEKLLIRATELDSSDPLPWASLIIVSRGLEQGMEVHQEYFEEVTRRDPFHFDAHSMYLQAICKKWGGSHEEMFEFARNASAKAPKGSPIHLLVPIAHIERWMEGFEDIKPEMRDSYFSQPEVLQEIKDSADKTIFSTEWDPQTPETKAENIFAFLFWLSGSTLKAKKAFDKIGTKPCSFPWEYYQLGWESAFDYARKECSKPLISKEEIELT